MEMITMHHGTTRLGVLAAVAAGSLTLAACGSPGTPAAVPTVAVDNAGAQSPAGSGSTTTGSSPAGSSIDGSYEIAAGEAALVRLDVAGSALTLVDAAPADGWRLVEDDRDSDEVELTYVRGSDVVELDAEIDDGRFETELRMKSLPVSGPVTYQVSDAGSVTVEVVGDRVTLVGHEAAPGWAATVDERDLAGGEVEIRFRSDQVAGAATDFDAEIDDGRLEIDIDTVSGRR